MTESWKQLPEYSTFPCSSDLAAKSSGYDWIGPSVEDRLSRYGYDACAATFGINALLYPIEAKQRLRRRLSHHGIVYCL